MADNKTTIEIQSEFNDKGIKAAKQGLKDIAEETKKTANETKKAEQATNANTEATSRFSLKALAVWGAVAVSVKKVVDFATQSINAHLQNARAVRTLDESFRALGITNVAAIKNAKVFATEMQNATGIADETFLNAQRMLANFGIVGQKAQESIKAAYALAVGRNMDFAAAMDLVTRAAAGQTQSLTRQGIQINKNIPESERYNDILKQINDKFGAAAQAQIGDSITQVEALKQKWGDFKEIIGALLIPAFDLLISKATKAVDILNELVGNDKNAIEATIAADKKRLELLNRRYIIEQQAAITNAKNGQISEIYAKRLKDLENEMLMVSTAINENQKTLKKDAEELAKKEQEINNQTAQIAKNKLAAENSTKAQEESLKNQQSIIAQMGLNAEKPTEQTSSWGTLTSKETDLSNAAEYAAAEAHLNEMLELKRLYIEEQITDEQLKNEALLNLDKQYVEQLGLLDEQSAADKKAREQKSANDRKAINQKAVSDLISLSNSSNKQFAAIGKTAAIATATMDTYKAANAAYSAMAGIPVVGPALGAAAAAAAIAAGFNNVAQISNIKLAQGGLVKAVSGGVNAVIGEGGSDEAVLPLNNRRALNRIGGAIAESTAQSGDSINNNAVNININVSATGGLQAFLDELTEATRNGTTEALQYANIAAKAGAKESGYSV